MSQTTAQLAAASNVAGVAESMRRVSALGAATFDTTPVLWTPAVDSLPSDGVLSLMAGSAKGLKVGWVVILAILILVMNFKSVPSYAATSLTSGLLVHPVIVHADAALPSWITGSDPGTSKPLSNSGTLSGACPPPSPCHPVDDGLGPADEAFESFHPRTIEGRFSVVNASIALGGA